MSENIPPSHGNGGRSGGRPLLEGEMIGPKGGILRMFPKGVSGNPGGIQGEYQQVRRLCAQHSVEASRRLIELMRGSDERVAYMAATSIIERGVGKVRDHSAEESAMARVDLSRLSQSDQELLVRLLKRVMGIQDEPKPADGVTIEQPTEKGP